MNIIINNKEFEITQGATLLAALQISGIALEGIATALNGEVIKASDRATCKLTEGDVILVIEPFYGG